MFCGIVFRNGYEFPRRSSGQPRSNILVSRRDFTSIQWIGGSANSFFRAFKHRRGFGMDKIHPGNWWHTETDRGLWEGDGSSLITVSSSPLGNLSTVNQHMYAVCLYFITCYVWKFLLLASATVYCRLGCDVFKFRICKRKSPACVFYVFIFSFGAVVYKWNVIDKCLHP